jgi:hypothetical protein
MNQENVMTTTLTYIKAREQTNDLQREAHRHRRYGEVRHVAVIRSAGSHFKLLPTRAALRRRWGDGGRRVTDRSPVDRLGLPEGFPNPLA